MINSTEFIIHHFLDFSVKTGVSLLRSNSNNPAKICSVPDNGDCLVSVISYIIERIVSYNGESKFVIYENRYVVMELWGKPKIF